MIDITKKYRTRDGREVRIYATDGEPDWPVHGAIIGRNGEWIAQAWRRDGNIYRNDEYASENDLIEVKPRIKREVWVNVYYDEVLGHGCIGAAYTSRTEADYAAGGLNRRACYPLTMDCEEGEGL